MWAPVGQQPEVPAPGKNEKQVVYGGVNYKTGRLTYTLAATKCGGAFLVFLIALLKQYVGRHIVLICDNGRFHKTHAECLGDHLRLNQSNGASREPSCTTVAFAAGLGRQVGRGENQGVARGLCANRVSRVKLWP